MGMGLLAGIASTESALDAERVRMDIVAQNIANAQTTRDVDGKPYQRRVVTFESELIRNSGISGQPTTALKVSEIARDETPGPQIFNPQHPHANADGMVEMPNVQLSKEMVDLITASRAYEANLKVVSTSRRMASQAMQIGRV